MKYNIKELTKKLTSFFTSTQTVSVVYEAEKDILQSILCNTSYSSMTVINAFAETSTLIVHHLCNILKITAKDTFANILLEYASKQSNTNIIVYGIEKWLSCGFISIQDIKKLSKTLKDNSIHLLLVTEQYKVILESRNLDINCIIPTVKEINPTVGANKENTEMQLRFRYLNMALYYYKPPVYYDSDDEFIPVFFPKESVLRMHNPFLFTQKTPIEVISKDFKEPATYISIISAISHGKITQKEISKYIGINATTLSPYINTLISYEYIEKKKRLEFPKKKSTSIYRVKNIYFDFWFRFFYDSLCTSVSINKFTIDFDELNEYINDICLPRFCESLFRSQKKAPSIIFDEWQTNDFKIPLAAIDNKKKRVYIGKYYTEKYVTMNEYAELGNTVTKIIKANTKKETNREITESTAPYELHIMLFSVKEFNNHLIKLYNSNKKKSNNNFISLVSLSKW